MKKKAPFLTLLAFKKLHDLHPDARLVMVGDGPLLPSCKQLAKSLHLNDVDFTGSLQHSSVIDLFNKAICFVQHSVTAEDGDSEGTPVAILEAGAAGLPVIGTKHGGITDVVEHGVTGFLAEEGDIDAMVNYMNIVFINPTLRVKMGIYARKRIAEKFSMQQHINTIDELIVRALN